MHQKSVTLDSIGGGALAELFDVEFAKVLANIDDPNTDEKAKRSISMTVTFKPNGNRDVADVEIACNSRLAGIVKVRTQLFVGRSGGKLMAVENDPRQSGLFDAEKPTLAAVSNFPKGGDA